MKLNNEIVISVKGSTWSGESMEQAVAVYTLEAGNLRNALAISDELKCSENAAMSYAKAIGSAYADVRVQTRVIGARDAFYQWLLSETRSVTDVLAYITEQGGAFKKQSATWEGIGKLVREVRILSEAPVEAADKAKSKK